MDYSPATIGVAAFLAVYLIWIRFFGKKKRGPLPPGPKGYPFIGNLLDMPTSHEYRTFGKWGQQWGDIMSVTVFGQTYVVLNSKKRAIELLEKKSAIYSSRPAIPVGGELVGWNRVLVLVPYGSKFREYRRLFFQFIGSKKHVERFQPLVESQARTLIGRLYKDPSKRIKDVQWSAAALMLMMTYGYEVQPENDPLATLVNTSIEQFAKSTMPAAYMANLLPALLRLPAWFPGAGVKKVAAEWRKTADEMCDRPFDFVKQRMAAGTDIPNFTSANLTSDISPEREDIVKYTATSVYTGGAETSVSTLNTFFLCMTLHPEVQEKAQAEIDAVVGTDRFPTSDDHENLPYVHAIFLEVLRWYIVTPIGGPHLSTEDDVHEGYFIPKGSYVLANLWYILHDPHTYPDPMAFNPDRFMPAPGKEPQADPRGVAFGFGRRICPGMHLAEASVWLTIAMSLAAFRIAKPVDAHGRPVEPSTEYVTGAVVTPPPFACDITPRSAKAKALLDAMGEKRSA
ncbi:cytochrome P450 [Lenzites betulinus]|nr:cytochrome P450 [Lenzites betulinus]